MKPKSSALIGYWEAVSIGIGGMVGGGIFAVLGLAVELSKGGTPVAFAIAGSLALITAYSYSKLSVAFPSQGGTVTFLVRAFGSGLFSGTLNVLLWLSYIILLSLYAYAFGSYGATFFPSDVQYQAKHALISGSIIALTALNLLTASIVGRAENLIVGFKIAILMLFIITGIGLVDLQRLSVSTWPPIPELIIGGMIIFVAYEGFELIANSAKDVRNPRETLPKAYFTAVLFVIALYVMVTIVTVGNLSLDQIASARDYALAEAAKPSLGQAGFVLIAIAALLSTASAINATLYGAARFSFCIARYGELPEFLQERVWNRPISGLLITAGLTLIIANLLDFSSISTLGSAGFLLIFAAVNWSNYRLRDKTEGNRFIAGIGFIACIAAFLAIIWETLTTNPPRLLILVAMIVFSFLIEKGYRRYRSKDMAGMLDS